MKRLVQIVGFAAVWYGALFASAGRLDWPRAWICLSAHSAFLAAGAVLVRRKNPGLAAARAKMHRDAKQFDKTAMKLYAVLSFVVPVVAGFDAVRFTWSSMAFAIVYPGLILYAAGGLPIAAAMTANPFLETLVRIQHDRGHRVVSTGPYRFLRHPMYAGIILQSLATPLILGSWWCYLPETAIAALFLWRTAREDKTLLGELPGYEEYAGRTRYRLLPGVW